MERIMAMTRRDFALLTLLTSGASITVGPHTFAWSLLTQEELDRESAAPKLERAPAMPPFVDDVNLKAAKALHAGVIFCAS
jgi:hypothetical protein